MASSKQDDFDGYRKWLGITNPRRPPNHYDILKISLDEDDDEVIQAAAEQRRHYVESKRGQGHDAIVAEILYAINEAEITLLNVDMRRKYDRQQELFEKRQKNRQVDPLAASSKFKSRPGRAVGEDNSVVKTFAGIMAVLCIAFAGMAIFAFKVLPWSKQPEQVGTVPAAQVPAAVAPKVSEQSIEHEIEPKSDATSKVMTDIQVESPLVVADSQSISSFKSIFDGKTLSGWAATPFRDHGKVAVDNGFITLGNSNGSTGITWTEDFPKLDYELILDAKRVAGNDFFCGLTFPVGESTCSLIVGGWGGTVVGLSSIDGKDASQNETTKTMQFENDRWYSVRLSVTAKKIKAWIDDSPVINQSTAGHKISIRPEVELSKPLGICSWKTTAALRDIKWRSLKTE